MLEAHKFEQREENSTKKDRTAWSSAKDPVHCSWPCEPAGCWLTGAKRTTVVKNYRPISLIDVLCKLLSSVFANRINHHIEEIGLQEQAGFTPKRGCDDGTNTLKFTLQNLSAAEQEAYVLFVDLVKAFDSVNREMLWLILAKMGIPQSMINTIKKMYTGITININIGEAKEAFNSTSGVKQGDNLAPPLVHIHNASSNGIHVHQMGLSTTQFGMVPRLQIWTHQIPHRKTPKCLQNWN